MQCKQNTSNLFSQREIERIQNFNGDKENLGDAEKFYLKLIQLPCFRIRIEGLLLEEDMRVTVKDIRPKINAIVSVCEQILENKHLEVFLRYVLHVGNFMNAGGYAENATGFTIDSLNKLKDTKSINSEINLLHYLVEEAEKEIKKCLSFVDMSRFPNIDSSVKMDALESEIKQMTNRVTNLNKGLETCPIVVKNQLQKLAQAAEKDIKSLNEDLENITDLTKRLVDYFCEDKENFKIIDFIGNFKTFCDRVDECKRENEERQKKEAKGNPK